MAIPKLETRATPGAQAQLVANTGWRLSISAGPGEVYRWAQLDDYLSRERSRFLWQSPCRLSLRGRVSSTGIAGTWGFGFWNDPFNMSLGLGGSMRRFPALPNAAWFFFASPPNYLSLRDDLPAQGFVVATFRSPLLPAPLLALGAPFLPLLGWPWAARRLRPLGRRLVQQDAALVTVDPAEWHSYALEWQAQRVLFYVDDQVILDTPVSPRGRLGLVLWIDNQYAAFTPQGGLRFGRLSTPAPAWLELEKIQVLVSD